MQGTIVGIGLLIFSILISYASLKLYDEPIRKWLTKRFMQKSE
jgi:peptidoglycan/LPS O-acetylase OafA/YrhL